MVGVIGSIIGMTLALAAIWGGLCSITGDEDAGNTILVNCLTAFILFIVLLSLFNIGGSGDGFLKSALPMIEGLQKYGNVSGYMKNSPGDFALSFVQLVAVSLLISYASNLFSFGASGVFGKITSRIAIVLIGLIIYGIFWNMVSENIAIKWCVYAVESLITVGSVSYPAIMIASNITGLKTNNYVLIYVVNQLPKTSIGKAISAAITSSISFLVLLAILELQYGTSINLLNGCLSILESSGSIIIMIMGIAIMLKSLKRR